MKIFLVIRQIQQSNSLSTTVAMVVCLLALFTQLFYTWMITLELNGVSSISQLWHFLIQAPKRILFWLTVPFIILSLVHPSWVASLSRFVANKIGRSSEKTVTVSTMSVMGPTRKNPPSPPVKPVQQTLDPLVVKQNVSHPIPKPLPTTMTLDLRPDIPAIYHPSSVELSKLKNIWASLEPSVFTWVRENRIISQIESVEVLYQPRDYYVIAANYPFERSGLEKRTIKIDGFSYAVVVLSDVEDTAEDDIIMWLTDNRLYFLGGHSRAIYEGSNLELSVFGRYVPRTLYCRKHILTSFLTDSEIKNLVTVRIQVNGRKLDYYKLIIDDATLF